MKLFAKIIVYLVIMVAGASGMVFEMVAPRLFAPYFGTSTYIWTSVIGVVLMSLTLGYFIGGKLAKKKPKTSTVVVILIMAAILALGDYLFKDHLIFQQMKLDNSEVIWGSFKAALLILGPINVVLGILTPVMIGVLGEPGNVYAMSTLGSIVGTFGTGYWLIPNFGLSKILLGVAVVLMVSALIMAVTLRNKIIILGGIVVFLWCGQNSSQQIFNNYFEKIYRAKLVVDFETEYNRIWIYDLPAANNDIMRVLSDSQSEWYLGKPASFTMRNNLSYFSYFNLAEIYNLKAEKALMIGGGAYTYAAYLMETSPNMGVEVVEIDPELLGVAKKYFEFKPTEKFNNLTMDGRVFLNSNQKKYDEIFVDAYRNGAATPFQLVTKEAMQLMYNSLNENGLMFVNVISTMNGKGSNLFKSEYVTTKAIFDQVKVFPVFTKSVNENQNIVIMGYKGKNLVAMKGDAQLEKLKLMETNVDSYMQNSKILTDDFAPVEYDDLQGMI